MLADDTTLHTSGKDMQIRSNMQDRLDQVSNWCDNNPMVINPIKTKSMTITTRQKHQLSPRSNMQDSLDQVSNWCNNNHMVINLIKTKSMTITTRQKHQLSPIPLDNRVKIDQVSEHRLLGITIDNQLHWDSHTNNVCKTVSS